MYLILLIITKEWVWIHHNLEHSNYCHICCQSKCYIYTFIYNTFSSFSHSSNKFWWNESLKRWSTLPTRLNLQWIYEHLSSSWIVAWDLYTHLCSTMEFNLVHYETYQVISDKCMYYLIYSEEGLFCLLLPVLGW